MDNKDFIQYLAKFLDLKSLNTLIKTNKIFANYKKIIRKITELERDVYVNTNNQKVQQIQYYQRPIVQSIEHYKAGEREGEIKEWYYNGQLYYLRFYKDGQLDGKYQKWYKNGQLRILLFYKAGKLDGEIKEWYENGQLRRRGFYKDDQRHGEHKEWSEDGQLREVAFYQDGKPVDMFYG